MNAKRQIQALDRYDWGNKTPQQVAKYVANKLDMLGYKVPKYMKQGKITQKQLDFHLDRVYNKLEKIVAKEEFLKLPKSEQNRIKNEQRLEKTIINYNVKVAKIRDIIQGSDEYSDKMKDFLIGDYSITNSRDKSFINEKFELNFIDINKLNYTSITKEIKRIRNLNKNLSVEGVLNTLEDSTDEDNFFNELLESEICNHLTESDKDILRKNFNTLNAPQKWLLVKDRLSSLKEIYEQKLEVEKDLFDYDHAGQVFFSQINMGVLNYGKY